MNRRYYGMASHVKSGYRDKRTQQMHERHLDWEDNLTARRMRKEAEEERRWNEEHDELVDTKKEILTDELAEMERKITELKKLIETEENP